MSNAPDFEAIRVLDEPATAWARSHRSLFLDDDAPVRGQIERGLVAGARAAGAGDVQLLRAGKWSVVGSTRDWFAHRRFPLRDDEAFTQGRGFPELGANACQPEFLVGAFAASALVFDEHGLRVIKGEGPADASVVDLIATRPHWTRAVAFLTES